MSEAAPEPVVARARRRGWRSRRLLIAAGVALALLGGLAALVRYGALTPVGRGLAEQALNGLSVGGYGRLHVAGLDGDVWRDFTLRRLTIDDGHGAWLDASSIRVRWDWPELFVRRVHIEAFEARRLTLARQPTVRATGAGGRTPVSVRIDRLAVRLELLAAFSTRYGLYDVSGSYDLRREGGMAGRLSAASLTHVGDRADADFDLGRDKTIRLALRAQEAGGGALAGALGLAADQPFLLVASASGAASQGQFQVTSRSGALTPIEGSGAWTPQGGQARGSITLAASRWLAGYQRMLGPQAQFQIAGARAPDGLDAISFSATSENVDASGRGEADIGRQVTGPGGLAVTIVARQAQRIVGWPQQLGAGRFTGTLSGRAGDWRLAGTGAVEAPEAFGYRLAELRGPLEIDGRADGLTVKATVDGVGGSGSGLVAALLGGRPHAVGEADLLPGGHVLVRSLEVTGPGLKVEATGDRTLLGGLRFSGQATFTNFELAHPGAKGVLTASWTAGQAGAEPWKVSFDATAKGFASGLADLDHLLGEAPTLRGAGALDSHGFQIAEANLGGAAGSLGASGLIGGDGALALKLTWQAKGPFEVGPLEITGAMDGSGAVSGTLADPRADLAASFASIDLPQLRLTDGHATLSFLKGPAETNGAFSLAAASPYGPAKASTGFRLIGDGVDLTGLDIEAGGAHAAGDVALRGGGASAADLTVSIGPGAFLGRGEAAGRLIIADAPGGPRAQLKLTATAALTRLGDFIVQKGSLTADGPLAALPYQLQASGFTPHGSWNATGSGTFNGVAGHYGATFSGQGRLRNADFKTIQPVVLDFSQGLRLSALANVGGGQARIEAGQTADTIQAKATMTNVSLGLLDQDFVGRFDADIALQGRGHSVSGSLDATLAGAGERGAPGQPTVDGQVKATLAGAVATIDATLGSGASLTSHAHLVLPAETSAAPFSIAIVGTAPMHGDFQADGEVRPLWDLLMGGERSLAGQVHAKATLGGTLDDPQAEGQAAIAGGQFNDAASGLKLTAVTLAARLDRDGVDVSQFSGQDGAGGSVSGAGVFSLARAGASSFRLALQHFRLLDNDIATAAASGQATLNRAADGSVRLAGALTIDRADVAANPPIPSGVTPMDVTEIHREPGSGGHLRRVDVNAPAVALDVTLKAPRNVFLKGKGLNVELSLDAHVTGTTAAPSLSGVASVTRGDYDFAGKRFEFDNRSTVQLATEPRNIRLNLTATRDDPTLTAVIHIEGTADRPKITLSSTPVLPNDEVLSQVLFGSSTAQLSPFDAAELASAMTSLSGGAGFDVLGNLRSFAHLDRLALGGGPGMAVSGGKYITDRIYVEFGGGQAGPEGSVEWRVQKSLSVVSKLAGGAGGDSQIEVRWRKDY